MRKRATQLLLIALAGALIVWWMRRESDAVPPPPADAKPAMPTSAPAPEPSPSATESASAFNLPKLRAPAAPLGALPPPPLPAEFEVPKNWLLRGSASKNYELRSDRMTAFTGNYSAVLTSHEKDIQPNLSGSAVQAVLASPYVGKRIELTLAMRAERSPGTTGAVWMYVTDPARVVIAFQISYFRTDRTRGGDWGRHHVVMDVPWHGEVLAYGFTVQGKGKVWADDVRLAAVEPSVPLTNSQSTYQLGVIAQAVSADGALANPSNMDFEDVLITRQRQDPPPPDEIKGTRY
jgi:hypothetical protein